MVDVDHKIQVFESRDGLHQPQVNILIFGQDCFRMKTAQHHI